MRPGKAVTRAVTNVARFGGPSCEPSLSATVRAAALACALTVHDDELKPVRMMLMTSARHSRSPASVPTAQSHLHIYSTQSQPCLHTHSTVKLRLHIAIGMQTRLQTGLQTGVSSVYTERLVCKPVCQPIVVTFTQGDRFAYRYAYRFCKPSLQNTVYVFGHAHLHH